MRLGFRLLGIASFALLVGCDGTMPVYQVDQEKRIVNFERCLERVPKGPTTTHYNDWDEVVDSCSRYARYSSLMCIRNCEKSDVSTIKE